MSFDSVELGTIISHRKGLAFKSNDYKSTGHPVVRVSNFTSDSISDRDLKFVSNEIASQSKTVELRALDIVIATVGSWPSNPASIVGKTVMVPEALNGALLNQNSVRLRVLSDSLVDQEYLFYALKNQEFSDYLVSTAQGSANQASITIKDILKYQVPWPEESERKNIASIIGKIRKKIELNTKTNQTLEQIAQAIFKSWFVDFDPVKAKMETLAAGGSADDAELAAMSVISAKTLDELNSLKTSNPEAFNKLAQTAALFPAAMQDSELGEIPEGWEVNRISEFGSVICGKTPSKAKPEFFGEAIPFIKIPDMHNSMFVVKASECLSQAGAKSQPKKNLPRGSICVSSIATVGKVVITREQSQTNQQINSIIPHEVFYTPYLYFYMGQLEKHFHDLASGGSATLNMNTTTFSKVCLLKPSNDILLSFYGYVKEHLALIENNMLLNQNLGELRDTLLPKLLSGEIDLTSEVVA